MAIIIATSQAYIWNSDNKITQHFYRKRRWTWWLSIVKTFVILADWIFSHAKLLYIYSSQKRSVPFPCRQAPPCIPKILLTMAHVTGNPNRKVSFWNTFCITLPTLQTLIAYVIYVCITHLTPENLSNQTVPIETTGKHIKGVTVLHGLHGEVPTTERGYRGGS